MTAARAFFFFAAIIWASLSAPQRVHAQDPAELVQVELLGEPQAIQPGQPFWVGVRLTMKQHWHTYWRNPGGSGLPT